MYITYKKDTDASMLEDEKKNVMQGAEDSKGSNLTKFVLQSSKKSQKQSNRLRRHQIPLLTGSEGNEMTKKMVADGGTSEVEKRQVHMNLVLPCFL
jgi:hypothetical protein